MQVVRAPSRLLARHLWSRPLSSAAADAVAPYRAMAGAAMAQREAWAKADELLHARMREHVPAALNHNGEESFDNHLVGVQSVLRSWGASETLCNAALFHSIYGTEGFQGYKLPLSHRSEIADLIGENAERLAWIFCMVDRASVDATVLPEPRPGASFYSRPELGQFEIPLAGEEEWVDFLTLSLADWLEQVEGAARKENLIVHWPLGQAWAYRRDAYAGMARVLGDRGITDASAMHAAVFAREPEATRHLVQYHTPAISPAAREAREALAFSAARGGLRAMAGAAEEEAKWGWPRPRDVAGGPFGRGYVN